MKKVVTHFSKKEFDFLCRLQVWTGNPDKTLQLLWYVTHMKEDGEYWIIPSKNNPNVTYRYHMETGLCSCPAVGRHAHSEAVTLRSKMQFKRTDDSEVVFES